MCPERIMRQSLYLHMYIYQKINKEKGMTRINAKKEDRRKQQDGGRKEKYKTQDTDGNVGLAHKGEASGMFNTIIHTDPHKVACTSADIWNQFACLTALIIER